METATQSQTQTIVKKTRLSIAQIFTRIGLGIIALILLVYLGRNFLIKTVVQIGAQRALGMKVKLEKFNLDLFPGKLEIYNLTVDNPPGFEGQPLVTIPHIRADFDLIPLLAGKFDFRYLDLNIYEVNLIKNRNQELNVNRIQSIAAASSKSPPTKSKPPHIRMDLLYLTIHHVNYIDYSKAHPKPQRITLGINREKFVNLRGVDDLVKVVVSRVVVKAGLYNLGLPLRALSSGISQIGNSLGQGLKKTSKGLNRFFNKIFKK